MIYLAYLVFRVMAALTALRRKEKTLLAEINCKVCARLPSAEFQKTCFVPKEFGGTMQVKGSKDGISSDVKPRETNKREEKVSVAVHEPAVTTFALRTW